MEPDYGLLQRSLTYYDDWVYNNEPCKPKKKSSKTKETKVTDKVLYEVDVEGKTMFGHKLAVNSLGLWVMEIKGSGLVVAVPSAAVTKVVPYTVTIKFCENGTEYSYLANADDDYNVDDFLIMNGYNSSNYQLARVVGVDTKSDKATKYLEPLKRL